MKHIKSIIAGVLALAVVFAIGFGMRDFNLKASEEEAGSTAVEKQETVKEASKAVEVTIPEKKEEPKAEEPKAEEPKAEVTEEVKAEEPKTEVPVEEAPAAEEEPVVTEEPAATEEPVAAEEPAATEEAAAEEKANIRIEVKLLNTGDLEYGDKIRLQAEVKANCEYKLQWQYKADKDWTDIKGETGEIYSFVLTEENAEYEYRAVATAK